MQILLNVFMLSVTELAYLFGVLIAVGFILGWIESLSNKWAYQAFGKFGIISTACIGTPIHEMGHALMCLLFGHKIVEIKFFEFNPQNSTLGYVNHSFNKNNLYQQMGNFFISLGPIFSGTIAISFFMYMFEPSNFKALQQYVLSVHSVLVVYKGILNSGNMGSLAFWVFIVLTMCTSSHIALSKVDVQNAAAGLSAAFFLLLFLNVGASLFGLEILQYVLIIAKYNMYLVSILSVSVAFSLITALIMWTFAITLN